MSRKSTKKASKGRLAGKRGLKDLTPRATRAIRGGKRAGGKKVKDLPAKAAKAEQDSIKGGAVYQHHQTDLEFLR